MAKKIDNVPNQIDIETVAPKLTIATGVIKGSIDVIPADLVKSRTSWNWDELGVGDHKEFPVNDETPKVRSSYTAFAKGTKGSKNNPAREPRNFASRTVDRKDETGNVIGKVLEVWRLADPEVKPVAAVTEQPKTE